MSFENDFEDGFSLDLTNGHLTNVDNRYAPLNDFAFSELKNWYCPSRGYAATESDVVVSIQEFDSGGFEATAKHVDMLAFGVRMSTKGAKKGKREPHGGMSENDRIRSVQRAKKKARQQIKNKGCDRLLTLTKRENDPSKFWNEDDWLKAWTEFLRLCRLVGINLVYLAVLEPHKKGNFHLHAAVKGRVKINTVRSIWCAINGGKGTANIDVKFYQHKTPTERLAGVAKYVSKYITKQLSDSRFNRKRYWASREDGTDLTPVKRLIMHADNMADALLELADVLCLELDVLKQKVFNFGGGFWFSYEPEMAKEVPF
jgi:hypothetical protein